jgi:hypothetical protein
MLQACRQAAWQLPQKISINLCLNIAGAKLSLCGFCYSDLVLYEFPIYAVGSDWI